MSNWDIQLDDHLLQDLYAWIDQIPLSRPKRRIERDFSDGVMVAEVIKYYFPNWVELHNYTSANNTQQKMINWGLLNSFLYGMETTSDPEIRNLNRKAKDKPTPRNAKPNNSEFYKDTGDDEVPSSHLSKEHLEEARLKFKPSSKILVRNEKTQNANTITQNVYDNNTILSKLDYEEKEQQLLAKDEQIQILNAKIRRLEHLLHLKDIRIQDLSERLEVSKIQNTSKK